tara:strand:- start:442 stop:597 length:156 start_codon:yes stop_codon:yes gene_type:complete
MGPKVNQFLSCCTVCTNAESKGVEGGMFEAKPGIFYADTSLKSKIDRQIHS